MVNLIYMDGNGHKAARPVTNADEYRAQRNTPENAKNFYDARGGKEEAKAAQVQYNYNDLLPDGVLKGCRHPSSTFAHDIDCGNQEEQMRIKDVLLAKKKEIGLLELSGSARYGIHAVCRRQPGKTVRECQYALSMATQTEYDTNSRGLARVLYTGPATPDNLFYLDDAIFEEPLSVEESEQEFLRLKERERNNEEEVPAGAKKANKHYKPWLESEERRVTSEEPKLPNSQPVSPLGESAGATFPTDYHGIPFRDIIAKYWEVNNGGFEPTKGDRDTLTYQLACDLRHICGKNFEWLDQVIPCYDGFTLEEKRQKIRSALGSELEAFPARLRNTLNALGKSEESIVNRPLSIVNSEALPPTLTINPSQLPAGLRESLKPYPQNMWPALLVGQMPALMALADGVSYRYCDGKTGQLGGMAIIMGEQASNKSAIEEAVERWLVDLRHDDEMVRDREDKVREANKRRKANERAQEAPAGVVRVVPITISCSKLLKRLKQSGGHCLYSISTEAETLLKSNGSGSWAQKWDIYRNAFGRERWGVDFNSDQSESGDVHVAYNWTILGTPRTVMKMFKGKNESNAENGLSSRCMLSEMPDGMFSKITVFKDLTEADLAHIQKATTLLRSAAGFYDTPRLRKAINDWLEEKRIESSLDMDVVKDRFRRRAGVIGFRCGVVFMLLAGKESNACIDFAVKMAEYTLGMQIRMFGPLLAKQYAGDTDAKTGGYVNGNIFDTLPSPFGLHDLRRLKGKDFADSTLYSIISRWKSEGWIEKKGKDNWEKKKTKGK